MMTLTFFLFLNCQNMAAPIPKEAKINLIEQVQGEWELESSNTGKGNVHHEKNAYSIRIEKSLLKIYIKGKKVSEENIEFDTAASPYNMDYKYGRIGIVKIVNGKMYWCTTFADWDRPVDFQPTGGQCLSVFRRPK